MMRSFDTIIGRTVFASLIGITLMHILSLWSYELTLERELSVAQESGLAERLLSIRRSLADVPQPARDDAAHELSGGPVDVHWSSTEKAIAGGPSSERLASLSERLHRLAPELAASDVVIGAVGSGTAKPHVALVSLRMPDNTWTNVSLFTYALPHAVGPGTLLSTSLMALGVIALSILISSWLTSPIRRIANAVRSLTPGSTDAIVPGKGPREVRDLAAAFNEMQSRIKRLIDERTRALAAVSHDLRTPLTRLKLRVEDLEDPEVVHAMTRDITELEEMIDATLSYLRGDSSEERAKAIDLTALLETLVDEACDLNQNVQVVGARNLIVLGRHHALKRAFSNLIQNGVKYGGQVQISMEKAATGVLVHIDDNGPGIPEDKLASVLEPFVRLEASRSKETGGVGLGLTIAKASIEADGGNLRLENRTPGGFRVSAFLPCPV